MNITQKIEKRIACAEKAKTLVEKLNACKFKIDDFEKCENQDIELQNALGIFTTNCIDWTNGIIIRGNRLYLVCKQEITSTNILIEIEPSSMIAALEDEKCYLTYNRVASVVDALVTKYSCKCSGACEDEDEEF